MRHAPGALAADPVALRALARPAVRLRPPLHARLPGLPRRRSPDPLRAAELAVPDRDPAAERAALRRHAAARVRASARATGVRGVLALGHARDRGALLREPAHPADRHLP